MILRVEGLTKVYPNGTEANRAISLTVGEGEVVGLVGPNGAGKTTFVRQVLGLLKPTSGQIWLNGQNLNDLSPASRTRLIRRSIRYVPQMPLYYPALTAQEILNFVRELWLYTDQESFRPPVEDILDVLGIEDIRHIRGYQMSEGQHKLLLLAIALFYPAPLLIMDEPTSMVDIAHKYLVWDFIQKRLAGHGILLASHDMGEIRRLCHRVYVLVQGQVILQGTPQEIARAVSFPSTLEVAFDDRKVFQQTLDAFADCCELGSASQGRVHQLRFDTFQNALDFLHELGQRGEITYIRLEAPDLEQSLYHILRTVG